MAETYVYDTASTRLNSVNRDGAIRSLTYDAKGNVTLDTRADGAALAMAYDDAGRLASLVDGEGTQIADYIYDFNNLRRIKHRTTIVASEECESGHWNPNAKGCNANRILKDLQPELKDKMTTKGNDAAADAVYDALQHGIDATSSGAGGGSSVITASTHYHYDGLGKLIAETDGDGAVLREYIYLGNMPVATIEGGILYVTHTDHLNSPQVLTNTNAVAVWSAAYTPFGEPAAITSDGSALTNQRFPGQYFDTETGFHQNWHRDYDPTLGRYLQSDPIGLGGGMNTYAYVGGNPVNASDPWGLDLVLIGEPGTLGNLLNLAAKTWNKENGGNHTIVEAGSGRDAINAMKTYAKDNGGIDGLHVFSHSGSTGIYFDQSDSFASLYSRGPGVALSWLPFNDATRLGEIDPKWFKDGAEIDLQGCKSGQGNNSFAQSLANHLGRNVIGSQSGTQFSAVKNGKPGEGFVNPNEIPYDFQPIFMVPDVPEKGFTTFKPQE